MAEVKAKYRCTEVELYSITELAFNNLRVDLGLFAAKKAKYDAVFVDGLFALRTAAMVLPDEEARNGVHEVLRNQLPGLVVPVKDNFNDLKGYIRDGWPGENPQPRYEAAGLVRYNNIGEHNWENVVGLCESMTQFIGANSGPLAAPGGMVVNFAAKVQADWDAFTSVYQSFLISRETGTARAAKIGANNVVYDAMAEVMKDGVEMVFRNDEANKKRFVFAALKDIVSPPGSASLKVTGMTSENILLTNKPVRIKKEGSAPIILSTDVKGMAIFENVDPGKYEGTIDVDGVLTAFTKDVDTGVDARVVVTV